MTGDEELAFHALKKIEIIVKGDRQAYVRDLLESSGTTGYTLIRDIAGMGHGGFHEGRLLFNDQASLVMFMAVASEDAIRRIAAGLKPLFEKSSGVMFITETQVVRLEHFVRDHETAGE
ncbi:MAG: P-II family nitrogen regulator [Alphaproteobacteria bacterium]|jgi:nitrogen regulatory protein PII|nr:P-II family nitrogen regulator [Alphaproteobacteria bacterium]